VELGHNRRVIRAAALCLVLLAGCGGASSLGAGDLAAVAEPAPPIPQGAYQEDRSEPSSFMLDYLRRTSESKEDRAVLSAAEDAGFERGYQKTWAARAVGDGAAAGVVLFQFRDDSGADDVLGVLRRQYQESLGVELETVGASGLGDASWGGRTTGDDESTIFVWRAGNLVALVFVGCFSGCDEADRVGEIARAYADAVDDRIDDAG